MSRSDFLCPLLALVAAFKVWQRGLGVALLVACSMGAAQTAAPTFAEWEGGDPSLTWYAVEVEVALVNHPMVEHAVVDAADILAGESDELPRCHKPANPGSNTSLASEGADLGVPSRPVDVQASLTHAPQIITLPLAQPQRIVQPPHRPPRLS